MGRPRPHIVIAVVAAVVALVAQATEATICISEMITLRRVQGIVVEDSQGGDPYVLPGATVKLSAGKYEAETTTDEDGYFTFGRVRPGNYKIRAELEGFVTAYGTVRRSSSRPAATTTTSASTPGRAPAAIRRRLAARACITWPSCTRAAPSSPTR
jgi:hypothetical protein